MPLLRSRVVTHPGLEGVAASELAELGLHAVDTDVGGVALETDLSGVYRANLHVRTATRVLVRLGEFRARGFAEMERKAEALPWDRYLAPGAAAAFRVTSKRSRLYHERAIAQRLLRVSGAQPPPGEVTQTFVVRVHRDVFTVSADSSGRLLHRRGYRVEGAKAPLRETLAAALLSVSGWNREEPLLDPFCGSGTIPIEAALMARGIAPGLGRAFAFQGWPDFEPGVWRTMLAGARRAVLPRSPAPIVGSDRDEGAIGAARANARRAGVEDDVTLRCRPLSGLEATPAAQGPGWVVTNPPYGVRVGDPAALRDLYAALGNTLRARLPLWRLVMVAADDRLHRQTGLSFDTLARTENGGLSVRFLASTPRPEHPEEGIAPASPKTS